MELTNTKNAFEYKSDKELKKALRLFKLVKNKHVSDFFAGLTLIAMKFRIPVAWLIKPIMFDHFCGGENSEEAIETANNLWKYNVSSILDFAVEGQVDGKIVEQTIEEIKNTISLASKTDSLTFAAFKPTALASHEKLHHLATSPNLTEKEKAEKEKYEERFFSICEFAAQNEVKLLVDAEEFVYQFYVDELVEKAMKKLNKNKPLIYTTLQMYRHDRLDYLEGLIEDARQNNYYLGVKFVRGAYLEKERILAFKENRQSPIYETKQGNDDAFDKGVEMVFENIDICGIFVGTHNEDSVIKSINLAKKYNVDKNDDRFFVSQLYGMSDHISFNVAKEGYNVAKYLPYGPVKVAIPYLLRRAQENSAMAGQTGRELKFVKLEWERRKNN